MAARRTSVRSALGAAIVASLATALLAVVAPPPAVAAGTVPYAPGAPVDAFPETGGTALPSAASLAAMDTTTAGMVDKASSQPQTLPTSSTASVQSLGKAWAGAGGGSPVEVRAARAVEPGQSAISGADAVGDSVQVELTALNRAATAGPVTSTAMKRVGTPALQIGLRKSADATPSGANNDVDVRLSYASFADAYGGNWSDRLSVTAKPACSLTTPEVPACQVSVPVPSANDPGAQTLSFTATPPLNAGQTAPAAPAAPTLQSCITEPSSNQMTAARTSDDRWDGDPSTQDEGDNQLTDDTTISGDDGNYDDGDLADDPYNDLDEPAARQASSSSTVAPAPELSAVASDDMACEGLVYQVQGGVGGYGMATAAAAGGSGSTPSTLETSADWQVGEGSGEFNWSYPIAMPSGQADEAPSLSLNYSSAVADGMTGPSPAQASQVGLGWSLEPGHISRTYAACGDDDTSDTTGDLCWRTQNGNLVNDLSLVLEGHSTRLIRDSASGALRLQDDPGWKVDTYGGPGSSTWTTEQGAPQVDNADGDDEAFRLISPDGTRYYFGFGPDSVWTVPVRGNDAGEPCNGNPVVTNSACVQGWQWNLDRVVDADGNRVKYTYGVETNRYRYDATNVIPYDRSGYLKSIQWGFPRPTPAPTNESVEPQAAVEFKMAGRCNASIAGDGSEDNDTACAEGNAPRTDPQGYRDAPTDLLCGPNSGSSCTNGSPAFFSLLRYKRIITHRGKLTTPGEALSGPVTDRYVLRHSMVDPDGPVDQANQTGADEPDLWLDQIAHQPTPSQTSTPTAEALPVVNFQGEFFDNMVVSEGNGKELQKKRLTVIRNELGGRTVVDYGHQNSCDHAYVTGRAAWQSTRDCFTPRRQGGTDNNLTWYHKYLVRTLTLGDQALGLESLANGQPSLGTLRQYKYRYRGDAGWRYDGASKSTPAKYRSWSDWRGYQTTLVRTMTVDKQTNPGQATTKAKSVRRVVVYRGLYNSRKNNTTTDLRTTAADGGYVATVERGLNSAQLPDRNALRGRVAEETVLEPPDGFCSSNCVGKWITRTYHGYQIYRTALSNLNLAAYFVGENMTRTHDRVTRESGTKLSWDRRHTINRTFDAGGTEHRGLALGTLTEVRDRGASTSTDKPGDRDTCTNTTWVGNSGTNTWIRVPTRVQVVGQTTTSACTEPLSDVRNFYDGNTATTQVGSDVTRGRLTRVETYTDATNKITTQTGYDKYGRVTSTVDGKGYTTSTTYNLSETGETVDDLPVKIATTTNQSQTITRLEKRRGLPISVTDYGNASVSTDDATTTTDYDGYGRILSVRSPNLQGVGGDPSVAYRYDVSSQASQPSRVKTTSRRDGGVLDTSYTYMDGWGRTIETQIPQADTNGGRVVTATGYNELGQPYLSMPVIANTDAPGSGLLNAKPANVERHELTTYDGASRVTRQWHMAKNDVQKYSTYYKQQGDRVITTQPVVGATVEFFDAWGRTSRVQQYSNNTVDVGANREHSAEYTYDGKNRLTNIRSTLLSADRVWTYTYDLAGRRTATTDPDTGKTSATYDANGNQIATSNTTDGLVKTLYDNQDRPTKRFKAASESVTDCANAGTQTDCERISTWTYDTATRGDGRLASSTSYSQLGTYTQSPTSYDLNGNMLGETYTYPSNIDSATPSGTFTLANSYTYNDADMIKTANYGAIGNLTATTVNTTYGINAQVDMMTAVQSGQPNVTLLDAYYDKVGQPLRALSQTSNTNKKLDREYAWENSTGRMTRVGGTAFGTLDYVYDLIGNPTSVTAHNVYSDTPEDPTAAWCYTYEPLNRLKTAKTGATASNNCATPAADTTLIGANQNLRYNYSADRLVSIASTNNGTTVQSEYNYANGKPHQTSSITNGTTSDPALPPNATLVYDDAGRIKTYTPTTGPATTSTYNPTGTLKTSTQSGTSGIATSYAYDTNGMRVARRDTVTGTGGYINSVRYLGISELTVKTPTGGSTITNGRRVFTTPGGTPLAIQAGNGTVAAPAAPIWTLQLADANDSLRFTRNQTAGTDSRPTYRPFGQPITTSSNGERGYLNKPQDPNGDIRLDQRNYQPQLSVLSTPDVVLSLEDPQSLNPYAYSRNNPIRLSDPTGLEPRPQGDDGCASAFDACTPDENLINTVVSVLSEIVSPDHSGEVVDENPKLDRAIGVFAELAGTADDFYNNNPRTSQYPDADLEDEVLRFGEKIGANPNGFDAFIGRFLFIGSAALVPIGGAGIVAKSPRVLEATASLERATTSLGRSQRAGRYLRDSWYRSTFPNRTQSVRYHLEKHGDGRSAVQYTQDAMNFFEENRSLGQAVILRDGSSGIKISTKVELPTGKTQRVGGYWTNDGRLVTFWD